MATAVMDYTTSAAITCTLTSLADAGYRQSAVVDNTTNKFIDATLGGSIQAGTTPTTGTTIEVWAYAQWDTAAASYTAGASGSDAAYTADGEEDELAFVTAITVDATSDQDYAWFVGSVAACFGGVLPPKWGLVFKNGTGAALNATGTNNAIKYTGIKYVSS